MNKKAHLHKEVQGLLRQTKAGEVRIYVGEQPYKALQVAGSAPAVIRCTDEASAQALDRLITVMQQEVEYFRDGRPIPITGINIVKDEQSTTEAAN